MSEALPGGKHWRVSCAINACLGGRPDQPLCARAWEGQWTLFIEIMGIAFDDVTHCEAIHARWIAASR